MSKIPKSQEAQDLPLPLDLVYEILIKIPVDALHRLRCVCRTWYHLISNPCFHKDHYRRRSKQDPLLLVAEYDHRRSKLTCFSIYNNKRALLHNFSILPVPKFDPVPGHLSVRRTQSCKGLVCLKPIYTENILVCNPSTKELIELPQPLEHKLSWDCVGFGYAPSIDKFKVVGFFSRLIQVHYDNHNEISCVVFTLGAHDGWRKAKIPPYRPSKDAPLLHGALHLMPSEFDEYYQIVEDHYIAAFDVDTEEYRQVPLPKIYFAKVRSLESDCNMVHLAELRGSLCLTFHFSINMLELWFLMDYTGGNWVKKYTIDLSSKHPKFWCLPIAIMGDGIILLYNGMQLLCYNPQENCFQSMMIYRNCSATLYVESFFSLGRPGSNGLNIAVPPLGHLSLPGPGSNGLNVAVPLLGHLSLLGRMDGKDLSQVDSN